MNPKLTTEKVNLLVLTCEKCGRQVKATTRKRANYYMTLHTAGGRCKQRQEAAEDARK
jgi:hypothetical protein